MWPSVMTSGSILAVSDRAHVEQMARVCGLQRLAAPCKDWGHMTQA